MHGANDSSVINEEEGEGRTVLREIEGLDAITIKSSEGRVTLLIDEMWEGSIVYHNCEAST